MLSRPESIPNIPGIYIFRNPKGVPLYIGKAVDLNKRLASYFRKNVPIKVSELREEAVSLEWVELVSEIEALIRESELIKKYHPKYNILLRDDKSYTYLAVTKEIFPRIYVTHQPITTAQIKNEKLKVKNWNTKLKISYIGPFTSSTAVRSTLKFLKRLFPFCTCTELHKRPCLNAQIGRCFGYCCVQKKPNAITSEEGKKQREAYRENIHTIISIFEGKRKRLVTELKREMKKAVAVEAFEQAGKLRDQINGIENIFSHTPTLVHLKNRDLFDWDRVQHNLQILFGTKEEFHRAEGYDISNISGASATASMVVFEKGRPEKAEYRKFKMRIIGPDDFAMHAETMSRRLKHTEWPYPQLFVIDGGKGQVSAVLKVMEKFFSPPYQLPATSYPLFVVGLAKREEELIIPDKISARWRTVPLRTLPSATMSFFQRIRDESHRFAKKYHHKRREIEYREGFKKSI